MSARPTVLRTDTAKEHRSVVYESFVLRKRDGYVKWAYIRLHSLEDAREAVNEALFKIYQRWDDVLASASADAYASKILKDTIADMLRKRDRRPCVPIGLAFEPTVRPILGLPADEIEQLAGRLEIHRAVAQLPERQNICISMHYFFGYSPAEIADLIGITVSTVRSHLATGRNTLASLLGEPAGPPAHEKGHHG
ncbi:RNA polymerase sigma factor [Streptomyces mobaraensis]|uniref:RNA polymerase sigma factor n=1 Tax=Streptomyces mobaraensis TaxID=35621 RepID=UPI0033205F6E